MYTGISEVVNKSNIDILIGAVMKNQQGQYQLNLISIDIFKEMSFFLVWLVSVQRTVTFEEVTEYYKILPASIA